MKMESQEMKRSERSRVPRKAKKIDSSKMEQEMESLGLVIENKDEVSLKLNLKMKKV